uniref:Uncharacterized protein n=1 Tax=Setaria viridis TaxID=4556 RepID=A0A4U6TG13_SETVI|nr:hypothetical protein SEVIR_8G163950v2 [Setaria viridis]
MPWLAAGFRPPRYSGVRPRLRRRVPAILPRRPLRLRINRPMRCFPVHFSKKMTGWATWVRSQSRSYEPHAHSVQTPKSRSALCVSKIYKYRTVESEGSFAAEERNSRTDSGCRNSRGQRKRPLVAGEVSPGGHRRR